MDWLFETLGVEAIRLKESKLDCDACKIDSSLSRTDEYNKETKCCLFKPYWSSLAIGYWAQNHDVESLLKKQSDRLVFLPVGVLHTLEERREYSRLSGKKMEDVKPCSFFNEEKKHCNIWQARPATCASFFCTSGYQKGMELYSRYEDLVMGLESQLVRAWFCSLNYTDRDLDLLVDYFDEDVNISLPQHLVIDSVSEATAMYKDCYNWVKKKNWGMVKEYELLVDEFRQLC